MCVAIIGGVLSGIGAAIGMAGQRANAKAQAQLERRQAQIEEKVGHYKAERTQDEVDRALGAQRAGFAANGVALDTGSASDVILGTAEEGALDVAAIRWNSNLAADNLRYKAKISDMNAKIAGASMPFAFAAPVINSIASYQSSFA